MVLLLGGGLWQMGRLPPFLALVPMGERGSRPLGQRARGRFLPKPQTDGAGET